MNQLEGTDRRLARRLVLDELFDLSLYQRLRELAPERLRAILDRLIPIEARHFAFWQDFFGLRVERLDLVRRLKLQLIVLTCRVFGPSAMQLVLEAIEVYGVRKYLRIWSIYGDDARGAAVRTILEDEFKHEDAVVTSTAEPRLNPERVRNIFLGLNDGLIEILGAVSGFFAAFGSATTVLMAATTVAAAGALSMAAGAWAAVDSESEIRATETGRRRFLGENVPPDETGESPLRSALVVGSSYFAGALVPVLPLLAGATTVVPSVLAAGSLIVIVSMILAFLSGMEMKRRVATNLVTIAAAVGITFVIGLVANRVWGISV
jgi:VIT1/CCC1 family predicted Fe2+/Mn2+ transporter